ncbi:MAG: arginine--tRNA ligase [Myxococcota bacterium]
MLRTAVIDVLTHGLPADERAALEPLAKFLSDPPDPAMGDLAFGCFGLAKLRRRSPVEVAKELAASLGASLAGMPGAPRMIASIEAAGPYLNFRADPAALLDATVRSVADGSLFALAHVDRPQKMMVEFSQPNTHKPFHVGHLRNVAIGDALVRIHRARGHTVTAANYYGDYGIDVAKCLWWLDTHPELVAPPDGRTAWLGAAYIAANDRVATAEGDDEATKARKAATFDEIRAVLHRMEAHEPEVWAKYQQTRAWCLDEFADTYRWLDVSFDVVFYESEVEAPAAAIVDAELAKGVFQRSNGAIVCDLQPDLDVPALVRKSDGTSLYLTWDLALAKRKFDEHDIERSLYVVGSEQRFHFQQLFLTLKRMGYDRAADCEHVAYELVVLPEGKMSSRKGTAIPLHTLREQLTAVIADRVAGGDAGTNAETVRRIAVACLKYGMLRIGTNKRVVFAIDGWTNPEGDTGAYLLYSLARIRSIIRKTGIDADWTANLAGVAAFGAPEERALLTHLLKLPVVIERAATTSDPSAIAGWVYDGARAFSRFYEACRVIDAEPDLRRARLALIRATDLAMTRGLDLLGITAVDAM